MQSNAAQAMAKVSNLEQRNVRQIFFSSIPFLKDCFNCLQSSVILFVQIYYVLIRKWRCLNFFQSYLQGLIGDGNSIDNKLKKTVFFQIQLDSELSSIRTQLLLAQKKEESYENKMADSTVTIDNLQKELKKAKDTIESSDSNSNGKIYIYIFLK